MLAPHVTEQLPRAGAGAGPCCGRQGWHVPSAYSLQRVAGSSLLVPGCPVSIPIALQCYIVQQCASKVKLQLSVTIAVSNLH